MINVEYDLSREEQVRAIKEGLARNENARSRKQRDNAPVGGAFWDIDGRIAEVVFEGFIPKHYPHLKLENVGSAALGEEAFLKPDYRLNGIPIDVKGTSLSLKQNPHLLVNEQVAESKQKESKPLDPLYILVANVHTLKPVVIGWVRGSELLAKGKRGPRLDGRPGTIISLPHSALHGFQKIKMFKE